MNEDTKLIELSSDFLNEVHKLGESYPHLVKLLIEMSEALQEHSTKIEMLGNLVGALSEEVELNRAVSTENGWKVDYIKELIPFGTEGAEDLVTYFLTGSTPSKKDIN